VKTEKDDGMRGKKRSIKRRGNSVPKAKVEILQYVTAFGMHLETAWNSISHGTLSHPL